MKKSIFEKIKEDYQNRIKFINDNNGWCDSGAGFDCQSNGFNIYYNDSKLENDSLKINIEFNILKAIAILHEIGHYLDFKYRIKGYFSPSQVSELTIRRCEVQAWIRASNLISEYGIDIDSFTKEMSVYLKSYGVSKLKLDLLINGLKKRLNKVEKMVA